MPKGSEGPVSHAQRAALDQAESAALERIREYQSKAGRGLWPLVLFAAASLWAHADFRYLPAIPHGWKNALGRPPPPSLINAAFVLYIFSAMVLSLTKLAGEGKPGTGFRHVGYLVCFYGFYHLSGALEDNYWAVLAGGFALLTLECYRHWMYYRQRIRVEQEQIGGGDGGAR